LDCVFSGAPRTACLQADRKLRLCMLNNQACPYSAWLSNKSYKCRIA
jgi:hypothetical protein